MFTLVFMATIAAAFRGLPHLSHRGEIEAVVEGHGPKMGPTVPPICICLEGARHTAGFLQDLTDFRAHGEFVYARRGDMPAQREELYPDNPGNRPRKSRGAAGRIIGTQARVSTLFTTVGFPETLSVGKAA